MISSGPSLGASVSRVARYVQKAKYMEMSRSSGPYCGDPVGDKRFSVDRPRASASAVRSALINVQRKTTNLGIYCTRIGLTLRAISAATIGVWQCLYRNFLTIPPDLHLLLEECADRPVLE